MPSKGALRDAAVLFEQAAERSLREGEPAEALKLREEAADCYRQAGLLDQALACLRTAAADGASEGLVGEIPRLWSKAARVCVELRRFSAALDCLKQGGLLNAKEIFELLQASEVRDRQVLGEAIVALEGLGALENRVLELLALVGPEEVLGALAEGRDRQGVAGVLERASHLPLVAELSRAERIELYDLGCRAAWEAECWEALDRWAASFEEESGERAIPRLVAAAPDSTPCRAKLHRLAEQLEEKQPFRAAEAWDLAGEARKAATAYKVAGHRYGLESELERARVCYLKAAIQLERAGEPSAAEAMHQHALDCEREVRSVPVPHFFVSYTEEDNDLLESLISRLDLEKIPYWTSRNIPGGADWMDELARVLEGCAVLIVLWTSNANDSIWMPVEIKAFFEKVRRRRPIIPLLVDGAEPQGGTRLILDRYQWIRVGRADFSASLDGLMKAIRTAGRRGRP